jgi:co-chaperonin GroES (HSP10)
MEDKRRFTSEGERVAVAEPELEFDVIPRNEWVLIRQLIKKDEITAGGVVKPGEEFFMLAGKASKSQRGEVVAAGERSTLQVGDLVIFTFFAMEIEGLKDLTGREDLRLVRDEEVYAVVKRKCQ